MPRTDYNDISSNETSPIQHHSTNTIESLLPPNITLDTNLALSIPPPSTNQTPPTQEAMVSPLALRLLIFFIPPSSPLYPHPYLSSIHDLPPRSSNPLPQTLSQGSQTLLLPKPMDFEPSNLPINLSSAKISAQHEPFLRKEQVFVRAHPPSPDHAVDVPEIESAQPELASVVPVPKPLHPDHVPHFSNGNPNEDPEEGQEEESEEEELEEIDIEEDSKDEMDGPELIFPYEAMGLPNPPPIDSDTSSDSEPEDVTAATVVDLYIHVMTMTLNEYLSSISLCCDRIKPSKRMYQVAIERLITKRVAAALAKDRATRENAKGPACGARGPIDEGAVEMTRWFEKLEMVFGISECAERNKVKFVAAMLQGRALTWDEIQRMEQELWGLKVKDSDISAYTTCFHELALPCPTMVEPKYKKIEAYIHGLSEDIKGDIIYFRPANINEAVHMAHNLMTQRVQARAQRATESNMREWENFQGGNNNNHRNNNHHNQQNNIRQGNERAITNASTEREKGDTLGASAQIRTISKSGMLVVEPM
nr:hypothetical protein [Tanacetum cinerariifolium]